MKALLHRAIVPTLAAAVIAGFAELASAQPCFNPPVVPSGYWKADGNIYDSTAGRDAALIAGATFGSGIGGQAFEFDGIDDYVSVAHDDALDFGNGNFTIGVWVKYRVLDGEQVIVEKWNQSGPLGWTLTKLGDSTVRFAMTGNAELNSPVLSIPIDTWVHFAVKRSGSAMTMFFNGLSVATGIHGHNLYVDTSLKFGTREGVQFQLDGWIDEVQLYVGTALADADILGIHAAGASGTCFSASCGDGIVQGAEDCDDGNAVAGDGCESDCTLSCGDGVATGTEECDDGNLVEGDGCDSNCTVPSCGNGVTSAGTGEECDDGNDVEGDGCDTNCTFTSCGNGILSPSSGEQCDDGDLDDGDGCESTCTYTAISVDLPPGGGVVTTDPEGHGATPGVPTVVKFETTNGGTVTLDVATGDVSLEGVSVLGVAFDITAPPATPADPLIITFTLDGSVIAPGVDLSQIQGLRNRIPLLDCTAPVAAMPDPCLASLTVTPGNDIEIIMRTSAASRWQVGLRGANEAEQGCVSALNGAGLKVAKARAKAAAACLKRASKGDEADAQACLTSDPSGKVGKVLAKTATTETASCSDTPPFGYAGAVAVNAAAQAAAVALVGDLFGPNLTAVALPDTDKPGSSCQAALLKSSQKLFDAKAKLLAACVKNALGGVPELTVEPAQLTECFARVALDLTGKIAKSSAKIDKALDKFCSGVPLATALPGVCTAAADVTDCLDVRTECRLCTAFDGMGDLGADCDVVDDGLVNSSCP